MSHPNDVTWAEVEREPGKRTYMLGTLGDDPYIECLVCRRRNFNGTDIAELYCYCCSRFHVRQVDD